MATTAKSKTVPFRFKFVEAFVDGPSITPYDQFSTFTATAKWVRVEVRDGTWVATKTMTNTIAEDINGTIRWGDNAMKKIRITAGANKPTLHCHFDKPKTASHTYVLLIAPSEAGKKQTYISPAGFDGTATLVHGVATPGKRVTIRM